MQKEHYSQIMGYQESDALKDFREKAALEFPGLPAHDVRKLFFEMADFSIDGVYYRIPLTDFARDILVKSSLNRDVDKAYDVRIAQKSENSIPVMFKSGDEDYFAYLPCSPGMRALDFMKGLRIGRVDGQPISDKDYGVMEGAIDSLTSIAQVAVPASGAAMDSNDISRSVRNSIWRATPAQRAPIVVYRDREHIPRWERHPSVSDSMAILPLVNKAIQTIKNADFHSAIPVVKQALSQLRADIADLPGAVDFGDIPSTMLSKISDTVSKKYHEVSEMGYEAIVATQDEEEAEQAIQDMEDEKVAKETLTLIMAALLYEFIDEEQIISVFPGLFEDNQFRERAIINAMDITHDGIVKTSGLTADTLNSMKSLFEGRVSPAQEKVMDTMLRHAGSEDYETPGISRYSSLSLTPGEKNMLTSLRDYHVGVPMNLDLAHSSSEYPHLNDDAISIDAKQDYTALKDRAFGFSREEEASTRKSPSLSML